VILGFGRDADVIFVPLGYYAASSGNLLRFSVILNDQEIQEDLLNFDNGNYTLSRNVGKRFPLDGV
jgi:hypothetical protein